MRYYLFFLILLASCRSKIDLADVEIREHGLSYIKNTNQLVNGEAIRKFDNGKIAESHNYKEGKAIGKWVIYGFQGEVVSEGFGTEIKKLEKRLGGVNLDYCILSIVTEGKYSYASLYMDNLQIVHDKNMIRKLSELIFEEYSVNPRIEDLLLYNDSHEISLSRLAIVNGVFKTDTIPGAKKIKVRFQ